jgi:hypothetical protein
MNEEQRKQEDSDYKNADNWLRLNGKFEVFPFKKQLLFKIVFTKDRTSTELIGEDLVRLTLQMFNEVKN